MATVDLSEAIVDEARKLAEREGVSVEEIVAAMVAHALRTNREADAMRQRATRGDPALALAILSGAPDVPPEEGDEPMGRAGA